MLGRLFTEGLSALTPGGSPTSSRPSTSLDSAHEDIHTRNLLFPDTEALYQHQHDQLFPMPSAAAIPLLTSSANGFDLNPDIELDLKDARVVILQDSVSSFSNIACVLYDSHPYIEPDIARDTSSKGSSRSITTPRRTSLGQVSKPVIITESPRGAFDRRPSAHARTGSYAETEGQRTAREYKEEMNTFSSCMFGSSDIMSHKGPGTKVHIIPVESKNTPGLGSGQGSLGRSSLRTSGLAHSYTSESVLQTPTSSGLPKLLEKKKVLITRLFPVQLATMDPDDMAKDEYPFPNIGEDKIKKPKPKQRRTPLYAIGLIITLPASHTSSSRGFRSGSYNDQDSFPSSFNSVKPAGWTVLGEGFGVESLESSLMSDVDDRIDIITQHWDVIVRALSHLQAVTASTVLPLLKQADVASPPPRQPHSRTASVSISGKRVEDPKPFKSNAKLVQLPGGALFRDEKIKAEVDRVRVRIVSGIKTLQVVTRQGRWAIWREEARWISRWIGGKEEGFFFYNLLTAFLGTHTEWLQALGPSWYRRRHYQQKRASKEDDQPLPSRTIVVARDKMAARRLIFLLSSFLSPNQQQQAVSTRTHRPGTSTSFGGYSQSPPSFLPYREESLRRKVNRRQRVHTRHMSFPAQAAKDFDRPKDPQNPELKTANLPIPGCEGGTRKTSAATTTTVTPVTTVPHFSTRRSTRGTGPIPRPGSSGSLAADDLIRSLQRNDSTGQYSNGSTESGYSRWGSVTSWSGKMGFWNKRRDSTDRTEPTDYDDTRGKLSDMVAESKKGSGTRTTGIKYDLPQPSKPTTLHVPYESQVKASINSQDGIIDIDVPLPDFLSTFTTFGSLMSSPSSSGYLSGNGGITQSHGMGPGLEGFEHFTPHGDVEAPLNVGGWLPRFHPDFTLQAIPTQDHHENLEAEIRNAMRVEPTPAFGGRDEVVPGEEQWVDVCTSLIADTTLFTIKRIRYRRLLKAAIPEPSADSTSLSGLTGPLSAAMASASIYGNPYSTPAPLPDKVLDEEFVEDTVISLDEMLTEAVERMISQPKGTSKNPSGGSSRATSRVRQSPHSREKDVSEKEKKKEKEMGIKAVVEVDSNMNMDSDTVPHGLGVGPSAPGSSTGSGTQLVNAAELKKEVSRVECKGCILGALEEIARSVDAERQQEGEKAKGVAANAQGAERELASDADDDSESISPAISSGEIEKKSNDTANRFQKELRRNNGPKRTGKLRSVARGRSRLSRQAEDTESVLRQGVRRWMVGIESAP